MCDSEVPEFPVAQATEGKSRDDENRERCEPDQVQRKDDKRQRCQEANHKAFLTGLARRLVKGKALHRVTIREYPGEQHKCALDRRIAFPDSDSRRWPR